MSAAVDEISNFFDTTILVPDNGEMLLRDHLERSRLEPPGKVSRNFPFWSSRELLQIHVVTAMYICAKGMTTVTYS